jgi:FKBP-type peptidyl-prolyl cis-trans isomerase (trigger factor)
MSIGIAAARECIPFRVPLTVSTQYANKALEHKDAVVDVKIHRIG